jgi:hypothetical protein
MPTGVADHHAAASGRRPLLALKTGGCAIPPMTRHVFFSLLVVVFTGRECTARQYLPG